MTNGSEPIPARTNRPRTPSQDMTNGSEPPSRLTLQSEPVRPGWLEPAGPSAYRDRPCWPCRPDCPPVLSLAVTPAAALPLGFLGATPSRGHPKQGPPQAGATPRRATPGGLSPWGHPKKGHPRHAAPRPSQGAPGRPAILRARALSRRRSAFIHAPLMHTRPLCSRASRVLATQGTRSASRVPSGPATTCAAHPLPPSPRQAI
jgi:hypothetical protein